jgi:hypothetical protein
MSTHVQAAAKTPRPAPAACLLVDFLPVGIRKTTRPGCRKILQWMLPPHRSEAYSAYQNLDFI